MRTLRNAMVVVAIASLSLVACGTEGPREVVLDGSGNVVQTGAQGAKAAAKGTAAGTDVSSKARTKDRGATSSVSAEDAATEEPADEKKGTTSAARAEAEDFPTHVEGTQRAPVTATVASQCVMPGGVQEITIRTTPEYAVSWATLWPDGDAHFPWKGYGAGKVPPSGIYTETFTIPLNAPLGEARSDIAVAGETDDERHTAFENLFWLIKKGC